VRTLAWSVLALLGCDVRTSGGRVEADATTTWRGEAYALVVPEGAAVVARAQGLAIDAADGSRWFDVRRQVGPMVPTVVVQEAVRDTCERPLWDRPAQPIPSTWTLGGSCFIRDKRHWILGAGEQHGADALVTVYLANADHLTLEDAWVDFVRTALTLAAGPSPAAVPSADDIRQRVRVAAASGGIGPAPVPGGGELSARVSESLVDLWEARGAATLPPVP
jgi:hypothetical protein